MRSISISARRFLQRLTEMHLGLLPGWDTADDGERSCIGCGRDAGATKLVTGRREGLCRECAESAALGLAGPSTGVAPPRTRCVFCTIKVAADRRFHLWPDGAVCDSCIRLSLQIFAANDGPTERHWLT